MGFWSISKHQLSRTMAGGMLGKRRQRRETLALPSPLLAYCIAVLLAALAQIARIPLHPQTAFPLITYVPVILLSVWYCGFRPGLVTTVLCTLEYLYFATGPVHSVAMFDWQNWVGVLVLPLAGVISGIRFERFRKADRSRKQARSQADLLRGNLAAIVDSSDDAIIGIDLKGVIATWNRAAEKMYGHSANEATGQHITFFMDPRAANEELAIQARIRNGKNVDHYETRRRRKDGEEVFVSVSVSPIRDASGQIIGMSKIARDITARKQMEKVLRESEETLRKSQRIAGLGSFVMDLRTGSWTSSDVLEQILGIGKSHDHTLAGWLALIHPDDRAFMAEHLAIEEMDHGQPLSSDFRIIRPSDRAVRWMHGDCESEIDALEKRVLHHSTIRDITDQKRNEETRSRQAKELAVRTAFLRSIVEHSPAAIAVLGGPEFTFELVNPAYQAFLPDAAMVGKTVAELWPDGMSVVLPLLRGVREARIPYHASAMPIPLRRGPDAPVEERFFTFSYVPLAGRDASGELRILVVALEVTDQKRIEMNLRESEERLRTQMERMPIGCIVFDRHNCFTQMNLAAESILGYTAAELCGQHARVIVPEGARPLVNGILRRLAEGDMTAHSENENVTKDGLSIICQWTNTPLRDGAGNFIGFLSMIQDITERKRAERALRESEEQLQRFNAELEERIHQRTAQLEASNKELESFTYSVSHDLRAPLRGIDGWSLALLEDYGDKLNEESRGYLERVRTETQRMGQLIDDLLRLSRVSRAEMNRTRVDLSALASSITSRIREANPGRDTEFAIEPGLTVEGDPRLLDIALTNLLDNAAKFSSKRANAKVEFGEIDHTNRDKRGLQFYVRDNGAGFDMAYADQLFGPFQRLHSASEFPGTGIGLATVQRVILRHGGTICAESKPDEGATFYFTIGGAS